MAKDSYTLVLYIYKINNYLNNKKNSIELYFSNSIFFYKFVFEFVFSKLIFENQKLFLRLFFIIFFYIFDYLFIYLLKS